LKADLFKEILPSIMHTHKPVIAEGNEKDYPPFIVNKALSFHSDCILQANQMNLLCHLDRLPQYQYLLNSIRPYKRRYQPWAKREDIDGLEAVMEHYNYSYDKAKEAMSVLSNDQINDIKRKVHKGGLNDTNRRTNRGGAG
jgi:Bacteriophage clamp loader A subunit